MTPLTAESFDEFVNSNRVALVHFWAIWNGYDKELSAFLAALPAGIAQRIAIGTVDTDVPEHWGLCRRHRIRNLPFVAIYREGALETSLTSPDHALIHAEIAKLLA